MHLATRLQFALSHSDLRSDAETQLRLAEALMPGSWILDRLADWASGPDRVIFSEQAVFALQRLLVMHARPRGAAQLDDEGFGLFMQALLAVPTTVLGKSSQPATGDDWIPFLLRGAHFSRREHTGLLLARYHRFWHEIAPTILAEGHVYGCPIDDWYQESFGRSILEDEAFTVAVLAMTRAHFIGQPKSALVDFSLWSETLVVDSEALLDGSGLRDRGPALFESVGATQSELRAEFAAARGAEHAAWDFLPFARRPLVQVSPGNYLPVHPYLVMEWGTSGVYHRLAAAARQVGGDKSFEWFTQFFGEIVERYVRDLLSSSLDASPSLPPRVIPPQQYKGESGSCEETSDAIVDSAPDLILVEVVSGRLSQLVLTHADSDSASRDLDRLVVQKAKQLFRVANDLEQGRARVGPLAGVPSGRPYFVVVSTEGLAEIPFVREKLQASLADAAEAADRSEFVTLMSLEELELTVELVEAGASLLDVLVGSATALGRANGLRAWIRDHERHASSAPSRAMDRWSDEARDSIAQLLFPNE